MEIHGYNAHGSIDATIDGQRTTVPDDMANRHRQLIAEWEFDPDGNRVNTIPAYAPPNAPAVYRLYKSTLVRRLTEDEAVVLTAVLNASPVKSRMLWEASEWLGSGDPLFADLRAAISSALGESRADAILEPEGTSS